MQYSGAVYHVTVRMVGHAWETGQGLDRSAWLFRDDRERMRFLDQLGERVEAYDLRLYAYCLMRTHFHLYLETPRANLSRFMHSLETAYTVYSNLRRERHGPLVGRYKAKPVEGDDYHLGLSRYVHLNPVRVQAVSALARDERLRRLRTYRWSSYGAYVGSVKAPDWLTCEPVLALCEGDANDRRRVYRRFVESGIDGDDECAAKLKESSLAVGDAPFIACIRDRLADQAKARKRPEDARLRVLTALVPADQALKAVAESLGVDRQAFNERRRNSDLRGMALRVLCRRAGLTQREAATMVGIGTGGAVAKQLERIEKRLLLDAGLRRQIALIEDVLNQQGAS